MTATFIQISDAIAETLNAATFSQAFTSQRTYQPMYKLEELKTLHVSIVPVRMDKEIIGHNRTGRTVAVDVCVQQQISAQNDTLTDSLLTLQEEIDTFLEFLELPAMQNAQWMKSETIAGAEAGYAVEHLDKFQCFTGIVRITYKIR